MPKSKLIPIDSFSSTVQEKLSEQDLRVRSVTSALRMWERVFDDSIRRKLGDDLERAFKKRGTIGMWMEAYGVSPLRALIDCARALTFLSAEDRIWLLRETGETDGNALFQSALEVCELVLSSEREAYFRGELIDVDWHRHDKSWSFLWGMAKTSKRGRYFDHMMLENKTTRSTLANRKNRLKRHLPNALFAAIETKRRVGCRFNLSSDQIRIFVYDENGLESEWTGSEPASSI